MSEITIKKENIEAAYKVASDETKEVLKALFGHENIFVSKPNLDDYKSIKTYEDACKALELPPFYSNKDADRAICEHINEHWDFSQTLPKHIIALMKLETIAKALWGRNWKPEPDADGSKSFYYPVFALYTESEIDDMCDKERWGLLSVGAHTGAGFGYLNTHGRSSYAAAYPGFRLCQETSEKATYFGRQFLELWAEYLQFNFETGERLK